MALAARGSSRRGCRVQARAAPVAAAAAPVAGLSPKQMRKEFGSKRMQSTREDLRQAGIDLRTDVVAANRACELLKSTSTVKFDATAVARTCWSLYLGSMPSRMWASAVASNLTVEVDLRSSHARFAATTSVRRSIPAWR